MIKHYDITITNQSSTPGFRFSVMDRAYRLNIKGYVRRKRSGGLFIEAEGQDEDLQVFIEWCRKGPLGAVITEVSVKESEVKNYTAFEIQHN